MGPRDGDDPAGIVGDHGRMEGGLSVGAVDHHVPELDPVAPGECLDRPLGAVPEPLEAR